MRKRPAFEVTVSKPCEEPWEAMAGNSRERHCELCDRKVHNFTAMTSQQIEELVTQSGGLLCGRVTRRRDGSLVTLDRGFSQSLRAPMVAQVMAAGLLLAGTAGALGQSADEGNAKGHAVLTGKVLLPDGSRPVPHAILRITAPGMPAHLEHADEEGMFRVDLPAGIYDIEISQNFANPIHIAQANLHQGWQVLSPVRLPEELLFTETLGEIVPIKRNAVGEAVKHPVSFMRYLLRKLS